MTIMERFHTADLESVRELPGDWVERVELFWTVRGEIEEKAAKASSSETPKKPRRHRKTR